MADITTEQVIDHLSNMPVIQLAGLIKQLEEKWGVKAAPVAVAAAAGPAAGPAAAAVEQTEFSVILDSFAADKKIGIIKVVRELTGQGLAEAKATVEGAPKTIKENVDKKTAEDLKKKLEDAGAKVAVKPA